MCSTGRTLSEMWEVQEVPFVKMWSRERTDLSMSPKCPLWQLYSTVLCFQSDPLRSSRMWQNSWQQLHTACFKNNHHPSGAFTALFGCYMAGTMSNCCHLGAHSVYTIQPCTGLQWLFEATYIGSGCNTLPALLAEWPASFTCYCSNRGVELILK